MTNILLALSNWLHALATIVFVGYYLFTGLIYLPVFERQMQANALRGRIGRLEELARKQGPQV